MFIVRSSTFVWEDDNDDVRASVALGAGDAAGRADALAAANALVETVHDTLGVPRSSQLPMALSTLSDADCGRHQHQRRWKGLRIGKPLAAASSDPGMALDGQYWHYLDKWMFALARLAVEEGSESPQGQRVICRALGLIRDVHDHFVEHDARTGNPLGVRWKVNMDASPIKGMPATRPSSDAVSGLVAYTAVATAAKALGCTGGIESELRDMKGIVVAMNPAVSSDPLGWGLQCWEAQWLRRNHSWPFASPWGQYANHLTDPSAFERTTVMRHVGEIPFRMYGSWLGARVCGEMTLADAATRLARDAARAELRAVAMESRDSDDVEENGLTAINRVMLASALDPIAFCRRQDEPDIFSVV